MIVSKDSEYRRLTDIETGIMERILSYDFPTYQRYLDQIPYLYARVVDYTGTLEFAKKSGGELIVPGRKGPLGIRGLFADADHMLVLFHVFTDSAGELGELDITRLDSKPVVGPIVPARIKVENRVDGPLTV